MAVPTLITGTGDGADGSLITFLDANLPTLGWSTPFTNTATKGVYRNSPTAGSGSYLRVIDAGADHAADSRRASVQTYTSMSDIDTGADVNPGSGETYFTKSESADATSRNFMLWGTNRFFYFFSWFAAANPNNSGWRVFWCGDPSGLYSNDPNAFCLGASESTATSVTTRSSALQNVAAASTTATTEVLNHWTRDFSASIGSVTGGLQTAPNAGGSTNYAPGSQQDYPNGPNTIPVAKIFIMEASAPTASRFHRASLPGVLNPLINLRMSNQSDFSDGDSVGGINNGSAIISARFTPLNPTLGWNASSFAGALLLDTTTDWDNW